MALITEIRKQFWFILVVLGLALAAFIMMDAQSFGNNAPGQKPIGNIAGTKIDFNEFQNAQAAMYSSSDQDQFTTRNTLWNHFVEKALIEKEAEAIGLSVTEEMVDEMKNGTRLSPVVQGFFPGQNGQFDQNFYTNFKQRLEAKDLNQNAVRQWEYLDNFIAKDHLQSQISNMAAKAVYTPTWMAEVLSKDQKLSADFQAVKIPYDQVDDVEVSDSDLTTFLNDNKADYFNKEEQRVIKYLEFEAVATSEDSLKIFNQLSGIKGDWAKDNNDSLFVLDYEGFYPTAYTKDAGLANELKNVAYNMEVGEIYGPYLSQGAYNLAKLIDRKEIPDSVDVRHILIGNIQTQEQALAAHNLIDSLKNLIETGEATFGDLAKANSTDGSATLGGELGMTAPGRMVGPFNDLIFYQAEQGSLYKVGTQFGLHLVQVTKKKFTSDKKRDGLRLVYVPLSIVPSEETQDEILATANNILNDVTTLEGLEAYATDKNKLLTTANPVGINSHAISGLNPGQDAREVVKWAFLNGTEVGSVSPVVHIFDNEQLYYHQKFVIAALDRIDPKGYKSLDMVRDDIRPLVMQQKKASSLSSSLSGKSLHEIANQYSAKIDTVSGASFSSPQIPGLGNEPNLMSYVLKNKANSVAGPFAGEGGIYYVYPTTINQPETVNDISFFRSSSGLGTKNSMRGKMMQSLKDAAEIEDSRSIYF